MQRAPLAATLGGSVMMPVNSSVANCCEASGLAVRPGRSAAAGAEPSGTPRAPWVAPALSAVVVVTTAVDVVGNLLVILSVLRNRKLRNAGECQLPCVPCPWFEIRTLDP